MNRLERELEQVFVDVAMAEEGGDFAAFAHAVHDAGETFSCSCEDVAFAEEGDFTESACVPHHH